MTGCGYDFTQHNYFLENRHLFTDDFSNQQNEVSKTVEERALVHGKPLKYWKYNAEEDYMRVPISVLKYITCLEEVVEGATDNSSDDIPTIAYLSGYHDGKKDNGLREAAEKVIDSRKWNDLDMVSVDFASAVDELEQTLKQIR
jgi:hypothetical protein